MAQDRIVVGATGDDTAARLAAHRLRDAGHEVVFVGGGQTAEHLARTAVAEDASRVVVDADSATLELVRQQCLDLGITGVSVDPLV